MGGTASPGPGLGGAVARYEGDFLDMDSVLPSTGGAEDVDKLSGTEGDCVKGTAGISVVKDELGPKSATLGDVIDVAFFTEGALEASVPEGRRWLADKSGEGGSVLDVDE